MKTQKNNSNKAKTLVLGLSLALTGVLASVSDAEAARVDKDLDKVAGVLFEAQQSLDEVEEQLARVSLTRASRRVRNERKKNLMAQKERLTQRVDKARSIFGKIAQSTIFADSNPQHIGGTFQLNGANGSVACHSSNSGTSGICTIDSENISFKW